MKTAFRATVSSLLAFAMFGVALFWPAGTFDYWQAWVFIVTFAAMGTVYSIYLGMKYPEVLRRRMNAGPVAETRPVQKIVSAGIYVTFAAMLVVSAFDHRFNWSNVPTAVVVVVEVAVAVGLGATMLVVLQNSNAAANVNVEVGQKVVSTGMYSIVRHPMYSASLILFVGIPLALDSYWGLVLLVPCLIILAARILDEEKALTEELDGYRNYTQRVRSRLLPHVW